MNNRFHKLTDGNLAILKYKHGEFDVLKDGSFVYCAITGNKINIDDLKYWNVDKQEAYDSPQSAVTASESYSKD
tara:strand:- start:5430 stop:5651 length:222 start_codon:yes stop_codon:yes gene_type:complete